MNKVIYINKRRDRDINGGGCMFKPELIAKNILKKMYKNIDLPINPISIANQEGIITKTIDLDKLSNADKILGIIRRENDGKVLISVNKDLDVKTMRFTLAHELGHYYMNHLGCESSQIVELHREKSENIDRIEEEADKFASALLMDESIIKEKFNILKEANQGLNYSISILAKLFGVPDEDVKNRLRDLELVD